MANQELLDFYCGLGSSAKVRFLARAAYNLTVELRCDYDDALDCKMRLQRLQGANELQHHLTAELAHHYNLDEKRYPDDVLFNILIEKAMFYEILPELLSAFSRATK